MINYEIVAIMRNNVTIMSVTIYFSHNYKKCNSYSKNAITMDNVG